METVSALSAAESAIFSVLHHREIYYPSSVLASHSCRIIYFTNRNDFESGSPRGRVSVVRCSSGSVSGYKLLMPFRTFP